MSLDTCRPLRPSCSAAALRCCLLAQEHWPERCADRSQCRSANWWYHRWAWVHQSDKRQPANVSFKRSFFSMINLRCMFSFNKKGITILPRSSFSFFLSLTRNHFFVIWDEVAPNNTPYFLALWLLSSQGFFRPFEEKGPKRKMALPHLNWYWRLEIRLENYFYAKK